MARCRALVAKAGEGASAEVILRIAQCDLHLGDWVGALNAAARWLEHPNAQPDRRVAVRQSFMSFAPKAARLVFDPADAMVVVDGETRTTASGVLFVAPGSHAVVVSAGNGRLETELGLTAGETKLITVDVAEPARATSQVAFSVETPKGVEEPPASKPFEMPAPSKAAVVGRHVSPATIALLGVAAAAAGAATWLTLSSASDLDRSASVRRSAHLDGRTCYGPANDECKNADALTMSAHTKQAAGIGAFAGAAAFAISALVLHYTSPRFEPVARVGASPTPGGAMVGGAVVF
jgi:hypothetical protein